MASHTQAAAKPEIANLSSNCDTRGFVELPLEILFQIISAAQGAIIPWMNEAGMEKRYSERRDSLSALCQVCRSLRVALLPLLWAGLEACCLPDHQNTRDRWSLLTKKLYGQLKLISITQPLYASYVKIVNIAIGMNTASEMLSNIAPALALMPNLHTIQIFDHPSIPRFQSCNMALVGLVAFQDAFKDHLYPSVKRVVLPGHATLILGCFPEVREMCLNQTHYCSFSSFLEYLATNCDKLEKFGWKQSRGNQDSRAAAMKKLPKIRRLEYHIKDFNVNEISPLARLRNLEDLSIIIDAYDDLSQCDDAVLEVAEATKKVLGASPSIKRVNVISRAETRSFMF